MKSKSSIIKSVALLLASAGLLAGCGGSHPLPSGRSLFVSSCSRCHSLTGFNSPGQQGGDLLGVQLSRVQLLQFAREMPLRHPLTQREFEVLASYILAVQRRG